MAGESGWAARWEKGRDWIPAAAGSVKGAWDDAWDRASETGLDVGRGTWKEIGWGAKAKFSRVLLHHFNLYRTERDASNWSTEKLKVLLLAVRVENAEGACEVTEVSKLDGEASINNRKGKLIFFYEWNIKLSWTGTSKSGVKYKGHVEIPNLSDENDVDEVEVSISLAKDEPDTNLVVLMKQEGTKKIRNAMSTYISMLKTEFTQGMILPTVNGEQTEPAPQLAAKAEDHKMVQAFTHAPAIIEADKGGKFHLLDGSVSGKFIDLVPEKQIVMKWRFKSWPSGHFATVTLNFTDKGGETEVRLEGKGIPSSEEERTKQGWQRYYFEGIKQTFGYGARLF
ncbi:Activator of 90 kDa heat shock protein ATPase like protein 1 [Chelonia mydas]|uniref:Activator of 90 kDa heat shock protein ATPase homolog 1 n=1 Tax=Chelonia mydas TaxID=8469 RepID=M7ARS0_CHEMY|nr:Activator of 90 kDa heat shock protein ATPase like protein 1 [Chelonia mydas]